MALLPLLLPITCILITQMGHENSFYTFTFQYISSDIRDFSIQWVLTLAIALWDLGVHWDSNSQNGSSLGSVEFHSLTLSHTSGSMECDSHASFLAFTFVSPCLGREPKVKVATNSQNGSSLESVRVHSLTLSYTFLHSRAWNVIPGLPFWPARLQAFALVTSPKLGLREFKLDLHELWLEEGVGIKLRIWLMTINPLNEVWLECAIHRWEIFSKVIRYLPKNFRKDLIWERYEPPKFWDNKSSSFGILSLENSK